MPSKGERLELLIASGDRSVRELLEEAVRIAGKVEIAKLESLLELEETVVFYSHIMNNRIVSACIERASEKITGLKAVEYLRQHLDDTTLTGYIEVSKITRSAYELDVESEPEARLESPLTPEELLVVEKAGRQDGSESRSGLKAIEQAKASGTTQVEEEVPLSPEKLDNPNLVDELELATMMVYLLTKSEIVKQSRDPGALLNDAKKISRDDAEAFYRIAVELDNGEVYNIFYHNGRLCSLIHVMAEGFRAQARQQVSEEDLERVLNEQRGEVRRAILYRVLCPECAKVVLQGCPEGAAELYQRGKKEKKEKEKQERRRFRLLGFFRRS